MNKRLTRVVLLMMLAMLSGCGRQDRVSVEMGGRTFHMEPALTDKARERGLMYRDHIPDDGGMLFVFTEQRVLGFWMKNCKVDLDVIFLDSSGRIVSIRKMKAPQPGTADADLTNYSSGYPARFAIEVQGGLTDNLALKLGEKIDLDLESLKARAR